MTDKGSQSGRRVTQGDIARELNISRIAVSYALRRSKNVSVATHHKVLEAAKRLGYRVNAGARAMRTGSSSNLGLVKSAGWSTSVLPQALLSAILRGVNERDRHLVIAQLEDKQLVDPSLLPVTIREHVIDGALVYYTHGAPQSVSAVFTRVGLPVVWLNVRRPTGCVYYDEIAAGKQVAERLLEAGCKRFLWMSTARHEECPSEIHYSLPDREKGFRDRLKKEGYDVSSVLEPKPGAFCKLPKGSISRNSRTGIFAYSPSGLVSAGLATLADGLVPGEHVHLATVAGSLADFGPYPVETVCLDYDGMAAESLKLLDSQMENPTKKLRSVAIPPLPVGQMPGYREPTPEPVA